MQHLRRLTLLTGCAALLTLAACQSDQLNGLKPKIQVVSKTPTDDAGHYLIDFGQIPIGDLSEMNISVSDVGRSKLTLQPASVAAPFGAVITNSRLVNPTAVLAVGFTFKPSAAGPVTATVILKSDGGNVTIDLRGEGTAGPPSMPPPCAFTAPMELNFGNVLPGQTESLALHVANTGTVDCTFAGAQIAAGSDPAYTLYMGQATSGTIPAGSGISIGVTFAPTSPAAAFTGQLAFTVGAPDSNVTVALTASSVQSVCQFTALPMPVAFGNILAGHNKTKTVQITNTGTADCDVTNVEIAAGSSAAYSLASGQGTNFTVVAGHPANINVKFAPTVAGPSFTGQLTFTIGPAPSNQSISLSGSANEPCPNQLPDGSCPKATGAIYVNTATALYSFNTSTHAVTFIANFSTSGDDMNDIAIDNNGVMLGASYTELYSVSPTTGATVALASLSISANALTFSPTNDIVVAGGGVVQLLDRSTYALKRTLVSSSYASSGDIVALPDGYLYWSVTGSGNDKLIKIDPSTGGTSVVGTLGTTKVWGLAYAASTLFGFSDLDEYLIINSSNAGGAATSSSQAWYGATSNPTTW